MTEEFTTEEFIIEGRNAVLEAFRAEERPSISCMCRRDKGRACPVYYQRSKKNRIPS